MVAAAQSLRRGKTSLSAQQIYFASGRRDMPMLIRFSFVHAQLSVAHPDMRHDTRQFALELGLAIGAFDDRDIGAKVAHIVGPIEVVLMRHFPADRVEPGGEDVERRRHRAFLLDRVLRRWDERHPAEMDLVVKDVGAGCKAVVTTWQQFKLIADVWGVEKGKFNGH